MRLVFMGPPGAGKGTQSARLIERLSIPHLSTGDMLRQARDQGSRVGQLAAEYLDRGQLVPDSVVVAIVGERLQDADCRRGCLFDGFPRTVEQARQLDKLLDELACPLDAVVLLHVDEDQLVQRLLDRGRQDDRLETIRRRFEQYREQTSPLIDYYHEKGLLHVIDGNGSPDEVFQQITTVLEGLSEGGAS